MMSNISRTLARYIIREEIGIDLGNDQANQTRDAAMAEARQEAIDKFLAGEGLSYFWQRWATGDTVRGDTGLVPLLRESRLIEGEVNFTKYQHPIVGVLTVRQDTGWKSIYVQR